MPGVCEHVFPAKLQCHLVFPVLVLLPSKLFFKLAFKRSKGNYWLTLMKSPEVDFSQQDLESRCTYPVIAINADQYKTTNLLKTSRDYFFGNLIVQFSGVDFVDVNSCYNVLSWTCLDWIHIVSLEPVLLDDLWALHFLISPLFFAKISPVVTT